MNTDKLISVIIPFFNSEKHLKKCIDSITLQSYNELEIILVNDGSEDNSINIAKKAAENDTRIRLINIESSGVSVARNVGLREATGSYIMFVDSDDMMNTNIIKRMMLMMERTEADIVTCKIERTEHLKEEPLAPKISYDVYTKKEYLRLFFKIKSNKWVHYPVAKLYKKDQLPLPLYPPGIRVGEDVLGTYLALTKAKKIVSLNDIGYYYFINPESATGSFSEKDFDLIEVWDQMVNVTKSIKPDHKYAMLGRDRINFTLLLRMITQVPANVIKKKYSSQEKTLLKDLRRCEKRLLDSPIILSRKLMIMLLCHMYTPAACAGNLYVLLRKKLKI